MPDKSNSVTIVSIFGIILAAACVQQDGSVTTLDDSGVCALTSSDAAVIETVRKTEQQKELLYCPSECVDDIDDEAPVCAPGDYGEEISE